MLKSIRILCIFSFSGSCRGSDCVTMSYFRNRSISSINPFYIIGFCIPLRIQGLVTSLSRANLFYLCLKCRVRVPTTKSAIRLDCRRKTRNTYAIDIGNGVRAGIGTAVRLIGDGVFLPYILTIISHIFSNCPTPIEIDFISTFLVTIPSIKSITIDSTHVRPSQVRFLIAICHTNSVACYFFKCVCIGSWILTLKHNCAFLCFIQNKRTIHMVCIFIGFSCFI